MSFKAIVRERDTTMTLLRLIGFIPEEVNVESLKEMERVIQTFPKDTNPLLTTYIPFGLYLGYVLVDTIPGAKWEVENAETLFDVRVVVRDEAGNEKLMYPLRRVAKFWKNHDDGIHAFAHAMVHLDMESKPAEEWEDIGEGTMMRKTSVRIEDLDDPEKVRALEERLGHKIDKDKILQSLQNSNNIH